MKPFNICPSTRDVAEITATFDKRILARLKWLSTRNGKILAACWSPSFALRRKSPVLSDIRAMLSPEQIAEDSTRRTTTTTMVIVYI
jgi:hypothetical protein